MGGAPPPSFSAFKKMNINIGDGATQSPSPSIGVKLEFNFAGCHPAAAAIADRRNRLPSQPPAVAYRCGIHLSETRPLLFPVHHLPRQPHYLATKPAPTHTASAFPDAIGDASCAAEVILQVRIIPSLPHRILIYKSYTIAFYIVTDDAWCPAAHIYASCSASSLPHLISTCKAEAFKCAIVMDVA